MKKNAIEKNDFLNNLVKYLKTKRIQLIWKNQLLANYRNKYVTEYQTRFIVMRIKRDSGMEKDCNVKLENYSFFSIDFYYEN